MSSEFGDLYELGPLIVSQLGLATVYLEKTWRTESANNVHDHIWSANIRHTLKLTFKEMSIEVP